MANEKELQDELAKSNSSLEKAENIIKDLKDKITSGIGKTTQVEIENLEKKIEEKNKKIVELALSVAKTQDPPRRVKLNMKYSNKYTKTQIKALKKNGISTENLDTEPEPADIDISEIKA